MIAPLLLRHSRRSFQPHTEGTECANFDAARRDALISLPEIARWTIPSDGDNQAFTVLVRDASGAVVYTATQTFAALTLNGATAAERSPAS